MSLEVVSGVIVGSNSKNKASQFADGTGFSNLILQTIDEVSILDIDLTGVQHNHLTQKTWTAEKADSRSE